DTGSSAVAPPIAVYQRGAARPAGGNPPWGRVGRLVALLFAVAAALRLARFNSQASSADRRFFVGLPSPSAAGLVAAFVWLSSKFGVSGLAGLAGAFTVTAIAGALMVSNFHYYSFKEVNFGRRVPFTWLLVIPLVFMFISLDPPVVFLLIFGLYAASGPAYWFWRLRRRRARHA